MIDAISHVNVWEEDQDEAKAFYTEKLGFEVRSDTRFGEHDEMRWLAPGELSSVEWMEFRSLHHDAVTAQQALDDGVARRATGGDQLRVLDPAISSGSVGHRPNDRRWRTGRHIRCRAPP